MSITTDKSITNKTINLIKNDSQTIALERGENSVENSENPAAAEREYSQAEVDDLRKAALSLNEGLAKIKRLAENLKADMAKL